MENHTRVVVMTALSVMAVVLQALVLSRPRQSRSRSRIAPGDGTGHRDQPPALDTLVVTVVTYKDVIRRLILATQIDELYGEHSPVFELLLKLPQFTRGPNIPRKGWRDSSLNQLIHEVPDAEFKKRLRLSRSLFTFLVDKLVAANYLKDNECHNKKFGVPAKFKVVVAIYHLAYGGTWFQTALCAGIAPSTAYKYTRQVCEGIVDVMKPMYMKKPTATELLEVQRRFASRRGIAHIGAAVDGTHVPWQPDTEEYMEDFHNYKGWYSILVVAMVNSFYMFVDAEVGYPGRMSDSTATRLSHFHNACQADREGWLGPNGMMITDGAFSVGNFTMTPFPGTSLNNREVFFNFAFSSTRMYVEQTFGMWKSRWRVTLKEQECSHEMITLMTMSTMVLHNMCMAHHHGEEIPDIYVPEVDLTNFFKKCPFNRCPQCKAQKVLHCVHMSRGSVTSRHTLMTDYRLHVSKQLWAIKVQTSLDI